MLRCLTLTQPWASLVSVGAKRIESRSWSTSFRGEIAIHASKAFPRWARDICYEEPFYGSLGKELAWEYPNGPRGHHLPLGAIVAVATLFSVQWIIRGYDGPLLTTPLGVPVSVDKAEIPFGDYTPGRYAWLLTDIRRLPTPVPAKGAQMLWFAPPAVESAVREQLEAHRG